jgi:hypothetical protein
MPDITPDMPADPFGPPEETLAMMRGLAQLHSAGIMSGLPEHVMTQFISNVFVAISMMNNAQEQEEKK